MHGVWWDVFLLGRFSPAVLLTLGTEDGAGGTAHKRARPSGRKDSEEMREGIARSNCPAHFCLVSQSFLCVYVSPVWLVVLYTELQ